MKSGNGDRTPFSIVANQIAKHFPGWPMVSPAYPTGNQIIPWGIFGILAADLGHAWALEQAQLRESLRHSIGLAFNPSDPELRRAQMDLADEAMPVLGEAKPPLILFPAKGA